MKRTQAHSRTAAQRWRAIEITVRLCVCAAVPAACNPEAGPSATQHAAQSAADSADHVMKGVLTKLTNLGVKQADLEADTALMYENAGRTELLKVRLTFFSTAGLQQSVLTSDSGTYMMRSQQMEARGNVVVIKTDGSRLTTSLLRYDQGKNEVSTDRPYTYDSGDRHLTGQGFTSDPSFSNITSRRVQGTGGGFTLPGQ